MRFALFDSPFGRCAIAWSERGIVALQLPEKSEAQTRKRLQMRAVGAVVASPPPNIQRAIDDVVAHMRGEVVTLDHALDFDGLTAAQRDAYDRLRTIPLGETRTYVDFDRAAIRAIVANPLAILVPAHRVLDQKGKLGDSHNGSVPARMRLLVSEAAHAHADGDGTLGFDPDEAVAHLRTDAKMARVIDRCGPFTMKLRRVPSIFAALAESIVYQQLSGRAAIAIWSRVRALFAHGHLGPTPQQVLRATDTQLRAAGLSRNKMLALRDLAKRAGDGSLPTLIEAQSIDDDTLIERLTEVRGIGRWTVEMLLMFRLGRPDILPVDDLGVRKGLGIMLGKRPTAAAPTTKELAARGERWRPFRTAASWYLWRATDLPRRK